MDRQKLIGVDGSSLVDWLPDDVDDTAERSGADRNGDRAASIPAWLATDESFRTVHGDGSDDILSEMLSHLCSKGKLTLIVYEPITTVVSSSTKRGRILIFCLVCRVILHFSNS